MFLTNNWSNQFHKSAMMNVNAIVNDDKNLAEYGFVAINFGVS